MFWRNCKKHSFLCLRQHNFIGFHTRITSRNFINIQLNARATISCTFNCCTWLPGIDGFEVCRSIRRLGDVPIVMVTARSDSHDVVAGLEAGADDYLRKPFDPKELSARIRALLRRTRPDEARPSLIRIDQLEILPDEGVVRQNGTEVHLTRTEFRLLVELASSSGRVLSREDLLERVWGYDYFGDGRLVDVHVRRLRTKIEPDAANPRYVVTVRGMGYKLQT